jgi:hypothetical protein
MKKINILFLITLLIGVGCQKQVLDKPPKDFFTEADVWNDFGLLKQFENRIYEGLGSWDVGNAGNIMLASYSDEAMSAENLNDAYNINAGNITPDATGAFGNIWTLRYQYIRMANIFLSKIDDVVLGTAEERNILKGEVKFLRAKMYFDLIQNFGGVPLITKVYELSDSFQVPRNGYQEIVDWIVKELDGATELVPLSRSSDEWGRITKGICLGTKAEVLLNANSKLHNPGSEPNGKLFTYDKNTWQDCADAAKAVIDMPQYELQKADTWKEYHDIFIHPNSEIIFARVFSTEFQSGGRLNEVNGIPQLGAWMETQGLQGLVDAYEMTNGKGIYEPGSGYDPSPETIYNNRDLRFDANISHRGSVWKNVAWELVHPDGYDVNLKFTTTGYPVRKFLDESLLINNMSAIWPRLRLATIYLVYAEAQYELGHEDEAREYVNKVRNRVHLPDISSSGDELFKDIQHERRIELCFEGYRFYDVRRWMIAMETENEPAMGINWKKLDAGGNLDPNGTLTYTFDVFQNRVFKPNFYYIPIPRSEMEKADLEQNPGY